MPLEIGKLITSLAIPLSLGSISGFITKNQISTWYTTLNQPSFNPPNYIFAPVWIILYILMGISLYMIWTLTFSESRNFIFILFGIQLFFNIAWSFIFFYFHDIRLALVCIVCLLLSIIFMMIKMHKLKPKASYINIPYILWVSFATILNIGYVLLN